MSEQRYMKDFAKIIRSKNSGPFEMTMDIIFGSREDYEEVKKRNIITPELISRLYNIPAERIVTLCCFDNANGIKVTIPRPRAQGTVGETDMHAAQQHVPLMYIPV